MQRKRESQNPQIEESRRQSSNQQLPGSADDSSRSLAPPHDEQLDGQLGPDELPDPTEVAMNNEAKLHH